ncbi:cysteine desulfurase [Arcobacter porcinus]|uniref:NifS/IscS family cysteine desulfurase n=1 Tax=Arcobacter porcinus TaxID=1935204 RepID=A0A5C2HD55_9BACT|nr:cysteine desulfurase [Arcobacter porcinus]OCL86519.1 Cysteine desulfurase [Arcobacter porcinus]OCL96897.1 Cysteine desulfurase [Aliarcobacter thereius]QEP40727.1 NifS/IscS family cysteine desulfurase [Arcobacter porcinus]
MIKLNYLQYNKLDINFDINSYSLDSLIQNDDFENNTKEFLNRFNFKKLKTFSFSKEGFLSLFIELKGKIAVSQGESIAIIEAAKMYQNLGLDIEFIELTKDGNIDLEKIKNSNFDYIFLSSYIMDTFFKIDINEIKKHTKAKIVSNASADFSSYSDIIYFDNYKISGYFLSGILCFNDDNISQENIGFTDTLAIKFCLEALKQKNKTSMKNIFIKKLEDRFKDDLYYFINNENSLENSFHIGLKDIKARDLIRTLAFDEIFLSNGEGCSLGLSKPSRVVQNMGYEDKISRNALSFSFNFDISDENIDKIVDILYKKYIQIKSY